MDMTESIIGVGGRTNSPSELAYPATIYEAEKSHSDGALILVYDIGSQEETFATLITKNW